MQIMRHDGDLAYRPSRSFSGLAQPREVVVEVQRRATIHVQRAVYVNGVDYSIRLTGQELEKLVWRHAHARLKLVLQVGIGQRRDDGAARGRRCGDVGDGVGEDVAPP